MAMTRTRRTPEQIVADLEAKIEAVKDRAAAKEAAAEVKGSPDGTAFLAAVRAVDKAMRVAGEEENDQMARALEAARASLAGHLVAMGVRVPETRGRRGRKRKAAGAA